MEAMVVMMEKKEEKVPLDIGVVHPLQDLQDLQALQALQALQVLQALQMK